MIRRRLFYLFPQLFMPAAVCVWCDGVLRRGGFFSRGKLSHGVCIACKQALRASRERV